jgi:hypothetical protein
VAEYALDFATYHVGRHYDYPRFLCYDCHGYRPYYSWNPYLYTCSSFRIVIFDDPYYYPTYRYLGRRVVYTRPPAVRQPRFVFKERVTGEAGTPLVQSRPVTDYPGVAGDPAPRRSQSGRAGSPTSASPRTVYPQTPNTGATSRGAARGRPTTQGVTPPGRVNPTNPTRGSTRQRPSDALRGGTQQGTPRLTPVMPRPSGQTRPSLERRPRGGENPQGGGTGTAQPTRPATGSSGTSPTRRSGGSSASVTPPRAMGGAAARPPRSTGGASPAVRPPRSTGGSSASVRRSGGRPSSSASSPTRRSGGSSGSVTRSRPPGGSSGGSSSRARPSSSSAGSSRSLPSTSRSGPPSAGRSPAVRPSRQPPRSAPAAKPSRPSSRSSPARATRRSGGPGGAPGRTATVGLMPASAADAIARGPVSVPLLAHAPGPAVGSGGSVHPHPGINVPVWPAAIRCPTGQTAAPVGMDSPAG